MEIGKTQVLALAMLVVLTTSSSILRASAGCGVAFKDLLTCLPYVEVAWPKMPPSPSCCAVVRNVDVPCLCQKVATSKYQYLVSPEKVVYVGRSCGLTIPPGLTCGSYTVPPKAPLLA